jgi:PAS domain S-box-containing protein
MNTFINNIPHMAWLKDINSKYIFINKAFGDVVGMNPEDLKNHTCVVCFGAEKANKLIEDDLAVIERKKQITFEETIVDISGKERYFETIKAPIFNSTGDAIGTVGIAMDITERKQMEEELRKHREEKYKLITENIFDFIAIVNEAHQFEYINESVTRRLGYASKELIGKSLADFNHPEDGKELKLNFRKGYSEDESQSILRFLHKEGNWVWLEARGKTFIDVDGKLKILIIARDITERKKAEDKLIEAYNKAEFYKDLVVHDMSNILNNIKMSFHLQEMWEDDSGRSVRKTRNTEIIKQQLERGRSLISNVRKLSDIEEKKTLKSVDVKSIIERLIKNTCTRFQGMGTEIKSEIPQETFNVIAGDLLIDAFENILINSTIHNNSKKKIIWVKISKFQKEGTKFVKIEFKDNGIGIVDNRKKTIFKRSYKTERTTGGMGFGLSLVKKIVSSYDGQIWVEDRVNGDYTKGSNFIILLKES